MQHTIILVQDQDAAILFNPEIPLLPEPVIIDGKQIGINLMYAKHLLGTFDTEEECATEISNILNCTEKVYYVSGYSDYNGVKDFWNAVDESELEAWANG